MNRRMKTVRGIFMAITVICLFSTIGGVYAKYSVSNENLAFTENISKIKTIIVNLQKK